MITHEELLQSIPAFSFIYHGVHSADLLPEWEQERRVKQLDAQRSREEIVWQCPATGLRVSCQLTRFADFPAVDWVLFFESAGERDTPIIEQVLALDWQLSAPLAGNHYWLHKTSGAPSNRSDFTPSRTIINQWCHERMAGGGGRSSNVDLPFFKIETAFGEMIIAVGWSGQWQATVAADADGALQLTAGLERTHFRLYPGEQVRTPRMLFGAWAGHEGQSNGAFRQLIYRHYAARRAGEPLLPTPFCNTCFTRGGGWLNECTAENQISLIHAYAPLGVEAVITDAGWFEGGWPDGAGNWTPRRDAYPRGMAPVAQAAEDEGMGYGLWFEPERVVPGTDLDRLHPEWILRGDAHTDPNTLLLNFGLPEARDYFFDIVKPYMDLPGFQFYRQDFNMDPLPYWRANDAEDRQGMTEMLYIAGLYAYWDRLAACWPRSLREECASGGRRIDLETLMRMHIHQDSDYWFDNETDQSQIWGLSQYLPNHLFTTPLVRLDDYSFHSTLASSLCLGWIADAPDFDTDRARFLLDRYRAYRHLLIGAWYPLLPDLRGDAVWSAVQYHRDDLDEGLVLVFRRANSAYPRAELALRGLQPDQCYELIYHDQRGPRVERGDALMRDFSVDLPRHASLLVHYRRQPASPEEN